MVVRPIQTIINRQTQPVDLTLFLRPFTKDSWAAVCSTLAIVAIGLVLHQNYISSWFRSDLSFKITVLSAWILFILTNAFYGGALTMFLTSLFKLPFNNLHEGLILFPEWKMVIVSGVEFIVSRKLSHKGSPVNKYWEFLKTEEGQKLIVPDHGGVINALQKPGFFNYAGEKDQLEKLKHELGLHFMDLYVVSTEDRIPSGLAFPKYSPWTKHMNRGINMRTHCFGPKYCCLSI